MLSRRPLAAASLAVSASLLAACGEPPLPPAATVRDSAGVALVENRIPAWAAGEAWTVESPPLLVLGEMDGPAEEQFSGIAGLARTRAGGVAVADGGSQEVRFFAPDGAFLHSVGGPGEGPGEFVGLTALGHAPGGGLWTWDMVLRRITRMSGEGEIVSQVRVGSEPPILGPVGMLPDGSLVLKELWGARTLAEATETGLRRDPVAWVRIDSAGRLMDTLGLVPGREVVLTSEGGRGVMSTPLFARNAVGAVGSETIWAGDQVAFELEGWSPQGQLLRRVRLPTHDLELDERTVRDAVEARVADAPAADRPGLRSLYEGLPTPPARPAFGGVLTDVAGRPWIAEWVSTPDLPESWEVLDPEGRWLGTVTMPTGFYPWDIGDDWILGTELDELDVERVVLYRLVKPR